MNDFKKVDNKYDYLIILYQSNISFNNNQHYFFSFHLVNSNLSATGSCFIVAYLPVDPKTTNKLHCKFIAQISKHD